MTSATPRVRFAPAPTGYLHVGSARAALFNWLFARSTGGAFVLRIEDTDAERNRPELIESILDALRWLGLDWDEGPYRQSERFALYRDAAEQLLAAEHAYLVDADDQRVEGPWRSDLAMRFRVPEEGSTAFTDAVRGEVSFDHANVEDFVVWRSNGTPTFILANAVDDADMGITHVIRGEDLLSATPKGLLVRRALGHDELPVLAHLPLLVNERRQKLSKRRDDVSVSDYRERGYLPEAMRNYLATLGWGPPDGVEVRPIEEIVALFRLDDVVSSSAFFDIQKLTAFNGEHLRGLAVGEFVARSEPWLATGPWAPGAFSAEVFTRLAPLVQERVRTLAEVPAMVDFLFLDEPAFDEASWEKTMVKGPAAASILDSVLEAYADCAWEASVLHDELAAVGESHGVKLGKAQAPIRVAVTGRTVGPPLFESLEVLGRERTLDRLRAARQRL